MLSGKTAIITGSNRGIGLATVKLFAKNRCNVWACARKTDEAFEAVHEEKIDKDVTEDMLKFGESFPCQYNNWSEFSVMIPDNCQDKFEDFDYCHIPLPSDAYCKCKVAGTGYDSEVLLLWKNKKIMVFEDDKQELIVSGWTTIKVGDIKAEEFRKLFE